MDDLPNSNHSPLPRKSSPPHQVIRPPHLLIACAFLSLSLSLSLYLGQPDHAVLPMNHQSVCKEPQTISLRITSRVQTSQAMGAFQRAPPLPSLTAVAVVWETDSFCYPGPIANPRTGQMQCPSPSPPPSTIPTMGRTTPRQWGYLW